MTCCGSWPWQTLTNRSACPRIRLERDWKTSFLNWSVKSHEYEACWMGVGKPGRSSLVSDRRTVHLLTKRERETSAVDRFTYEPVGSLTSQLRVPLVSVECIVLCIAATAG